MKPSPCWRCEKRTMLCHAHCDRYPAWLKEMHEEYAAEKDAREANAYVKELIEKWRVRRT